MSVQNMFCNVELHSAATFIPVGTPAQVRSGGAGSHVSCVQLALACIGTDVALWHVPLTQGTAECFIPAVYQIIYDCSLLQATLATASRLGRSSLARASRAMAAMARRSLGLSRGSRVRRSLENQMRCAIFSSPCLADPGPCRDAV